MDVSMDQTTTPPLLATCWTSAGNAAPQVGDERSPHDLAERMRAAVATGWRGFGLVHADLVAFREQHGLPALRAVAADAGIERIELEFIGDWWTTGERRRASDLVRRDLFEAAALLEVPVVKIAAAMDEPPPEDLLLTELDQIANEAREHGTRVAIEPMPFATNIRTLADGSRLLQAVGNPNVGLVVDTWHVYRAGTDYRQIPELITGQEIFVLELDDGAAEPVGSLWDDTIDRRRYPGQGAFDVPAFIGAIRQTGYDGYWGVEIISADHRARPIDEGLADVAAATRACFAAAEG
ncbi:MAG: sugar phosphate isomerase/epimerase family protein [Propioniciclava sp.]